jgi:dihydrofolate reductase
MGARRCANTALCAVEHRDDGALAKDEIHPRLEEVADLKQQPGKDIYLVGGARTTASPIDAGLVDELRLMVYQLISGEGGKALFATTKCRRGLELRSVQQLQGGRLGLICGFS